MRLEAETVVKNLFGASLYDQGRGFYVCLELLALVWGTQEAGLGILPDDVSKALTIVRRSHDFARRIATNRADVEAELATALDGEGTFETLQQLLNSLIVPIPGRRVVPSWGGRHLYPYVGELIHYDAVSRRATKASLRPVGPRPGSIVSIERYSFRGGGGLAHKILRTDPNFARLSETRSGLVEIVASSNRALARIAKALTAADATPPDTDFLDEREHEAVVKAGTGWPEVLRRGVKNIVTRKHLPRARRVEALMHFVPYCIARHQLDLARIELGMNVDIAIPVDCRSKASPIREAARLSAEEAVGTLGNALLERARAMDVDGLVRPTTAQARKWRDSPKGFFGGTLGTVGALNAMAGKRHFCLRTDLLESLVLALLGPGEERSFSSFCQEVLYDDLRLVVDDRSAGRVNALTRINLAEFEENSRALGLALKDLGFLHSYSDATQIVSAEVTQ